jgi:hypothetical protein
MQFHSEPITREKALKTAKGIARTDITGLQAVK